MAILGNYEEGEDLKKRLAPLLGPWEGRVKHLINKCELVDIKRVREIADRTYNKAVVRYHDEKEVEGDPLEDMEALTPVYSRAYFKLWEILSDVKVLEQYKGKPIRIANLCEGPGGFIHCLLDYRKRQNNDPKWKEDSYVAMTLNVTHSQLNSSLDWSYHKANKFFDSIDKYGYKVKLSYGAGDGDILDLKNSEYFIENDLEGKKCELVTADGVSDMSSDDEYIAQEMVNSKLFFSQIITGLAIQEKGGTFIMKLFDIYTKITVQLLVLLRAHYTTMHIISPRTTRSASSEKFVVCSGFKGISADRIVELKKTLQKWQEVEHELMYVQNDKYVTSFLDYTPTFESPFIQDIYDINKRHDIKQKTAIQTGLELITSKRLNDEDLIKQCKLKTEEAR